MCPMGKERTDKTRYTIHTKLGKEKMAVSK